MTIGTWIMLDPTIINNLHVITVEDNDRLLTLASYVLIAAGALSFIVGIVGCVGALREHQALLFVVRTRCIIFTALISLRTLDRILLNIWHATITSKI